MVGLSLGTIAFPTISISTPQSPWSQRQSEIFVIEGRSFFGLGAPNGSLPNTYNDRAEGQRKKLSDSLFTLGQPNPELLLPPPIPIISFNSRANFENGAFQFDAKGVIMAYYPSFGWYYNPLTISSYALALYGALYQGDLSAHAPMLIQARWLYNNSLIPQDHRGRPMRTFEYPFFLEGFNVPAGWRSALASAEAMSVLYIVGKVSGLPEYVAQSQEFLLAFDVEVTNGGYRSAPLAGPQDLNTVWYELVAHPQVTPAHILNGHLYTLLVLDWYGKNAQGSQVVRLVQDGMRGLQYLLHLYDENGLSVYDLIYRTLSCPHHEAHTLLLRELYKSSGVSLYDVYVKRWAVAKCP
jgi:hypothetical protein